MNPRKWKQNLDMTRDGKYAEKGTSGEKENDRMTKEGSSPTCVGR